MDPFSEKYCETCPFQTHLLQRQLAIAEAKDETVDYITDTFMGDAGVKLDGQIDQVRKINPGLNPSLEQNIRANLADSIDDYDEIYASLSRLRRDLARSCREPLEMSGTKNGLEITVSTCTSHHPANTNDSTTRKPTRTTIRKLFDE